MAAAVAGLIGLGNTVADAAELTEQTEAEIRRLRKLAAATEDTGGEQADNAADGRTRTAEPGPAQGGGRKAARPSTRGPRSTRGKSGGFG
jgi:hypothetical protein